MSSIWTRDLWMLLLNVASREHKLHNDGCAPSRHIPRARTSSSFSSSKTKENLRPTSVALFRRSSLSRTASSASLRSWISRFIPLHFSMLPSSPASGTARTFFQRQPAEAMCFERNSASTIRLIEMASPSPFGFRWIDLDASREQCLSHNLNRCFSSRAQHARGRKKCIAYPASNKAATRQSVRNRT